MEFNSGFKGILTRISAVICCVWWKPSRCV